MSLRVGFVAMNATRGAPANDQVRSTMSDKFDVIHLAGIGRIFDLRLAIGCESLTHPLPPAPFASS